VFLESGFVRENEIRVSFGEWFFGDVFLESGCCWNGFVRVK
jgi:hypothetical protein